MGKVVTHIKKIDKKGDRIMASAIGVKTILMIDDDERGYKEFEVGEDIHLMLDDGSDVFGEIKEILFTELTIESEDGETGIVSFDKIEGYL